MSKIEPTPEFVALKEIAKHLGEIHEIWMDFTNQQRSIPIISLENFNASEDLKHDAVRNWYAESPFCVAFINQNAGIALQGFMFDYLSKKSDPEYKSCFYQNDEILS